MVSPRRCAAGGVAAQCGHVWTRSSLTGIPGNARHCPHPPLRLCTERRTWPGSPTSCARCPDIYRFRRPSGWIRENNRQAFRHCQKN